MKKKCNILFLCLILLTFCKNKSNNESLYIFYSGDLKPTIRPIVLKNNLNSYVDESMMEIGQPLKYNIGRESFAKFIDFDKDKYNLKTYKKGKTGIIINHYVNQKIVAQYIFSNREDVEYLITSIEKTESNYRSDITIWLKGVQNLHKELLN